MLFNLSSISLNGFFIVTLFIFNATILHGFMLITTLYSVV
jgi:hypothetical protein